MKKHFQNKIRIKKIKLKFKKNKWLKGNVKILKADHEIQSCRKDKIHLCRSSAIVYRMIYRKKLNE